MTKPRFRRHTATALVALSITISGCSSNGTSDEDSVSRHRMTNDFLGDQQALSSTQSADDVLDLSFVENDSDSLSQDWIIESENGAYRITNRAIGAGQSLDSVNDGVFDRVELAPSSDASGQRWQVVPLENGFCRLTNEFLGSEIALDVTSDTDSPELRMRAVANVSGQHWRLTQLGTGGSTLDSLCIGVEPE